jgi:hypothetical protein
MTVATRKLGWSNVLNLFLPLRSRQGLQVEENRVRSREGMMDRGLYGTGDGGYRVTGWFIYYTRTGTRIQYSTKAA